MDQVRYAIPIPTVQQIADVLLLAPPDLPWANEGGCRHAIRKILILHHRQRWHPNARGVGFHLRPAQLGHHQLLPDL